MTNSPQAELTPSQLSPAASIGAMKRCALEGKIAASIREDRASRAGLVDRHPGASAKAFGAYRTQIHARRRSYLDAPLTEPEAKAPRAAKEKDPPAG